MTTSEVNQLIEDHGVSVYRFCRKIAFTREDADDLYQETMLRAIEKSKRIESAENPKSYLIGIAAKMWAYQKRRETRRGKIAPMQEFNEEVLQDVSGAPWQMPEAITLRQERDLLVQRAVKQLPDNLRIVLCMYYTAELSVREIAKATKTPEGTVKSRLYKARRMVKAVMEENDYDKS